MRSRYFLITLCAAIGPYGSLSAQIAPTPEPHQPAYSFTPLTGETLTKAFSGTTMDGIYKTPRQRSGTQKFTEQFNADGSTEYIEGPISDKGQWAVRGSLICFRYSGTLSGNISCFNVFKVGTCLYSYAPENIGRDGYPLNDNLWSAKTVIKGDISNCEDFVS